MNMFKDYSMTITSEVHLEREHDGVQITSYRFSFLPLKMERDVLYDSIAEWLKENIDDIFYLLYTLDDMVYLEVDDATLESSMAIRLRWEQ